MSRTGKQGSLEIYEMLRDEILTGKRGPGEPLVPIREFAVQLGVSKNTINAVYLRLVDDGYIYSVRGSGYYVEKQKNENEADTKLFVNTDEWKKFPWELWEKTLIQVLSTLRKGIDAKRELKESNQQIRTWICSEIKKTRGLKIKPEQMILCESTSDALRIVCRLFGNISRDIAFLEPCAPEYRKIFQKDSFQVQAFHRKNEKKEGCYSEEKRFRVLFGYLEQYLEELARPYPDNMWLQNWLLETGSYLLILDHMELESVELSGISEFNLERSLMIGSFNRLFPMEISLNYVILPDELMHKYKNLIEDDGKVYPLSYQLALGKMLCDTSVNDCIQENRKRAGERWVKIEQMLNKEKSRKIKVEHQLNYMQEGIILMIPDINQKTRTHLQKKTGLSSLVDYWYFDKEAGKNRYSLPYQAEGEKQLQELVSELESYV